MIVIAVLSLPPLWIRPVQDRRARLRLRLYISRRNSSCSDSIATTRPRRPRTADGDSPKAVCQNPTVKLAAASRPRVATRTLTAQPPAFAMQPCAVLMMEGVIVQYCIVDGWDSSSAAAAAYRHLGKVSIKTRKHCSVTNSCKHSTQGRATPGLRPFSTQSH